MLLPCKPTKFSLASWHFHYHLPQMNGAFNWVLFFLLLSLIDFDFAPYRSESHVFIFITILMQVMDRYVDPLVAHLKTMLSYRKFKKGAKAEVDEVLKIEKSEYPMRIVYCFGISHEHPGTFILTYIRSSDPHHEYVGLYPKGFKFRKKMFEDIDRLVAYFQSHINDPLDSSGPSIRSVAAMVPMRSPATGGSSAGGWGGPNSHDGGWRDRERTSTPGSRSGNCQPILRIRKILI